VDEDTCRRLRRECAGSSGSTEEEREVVGARRRQRRREEMALRVMIAVELLWKFACLTFI
jgi:hypothetical protein